MKITIRGLGTFGPPNIWVVFLVGFLATWAHHGFKTPNLWNRKDQNTYYFAYMQVQVLEGKIPVDTIIEKGNKYIDKKAAKADLLEFNRDYHRKDCKILSAGIMEEK